MSFLETYNWPGNIRQLENVIKRAVLLADTDRLISTSLISRIISEESGIILGGNQNIEHAKQTEEIQGAAVTSDFAAQTETQNEAFSSQQPSPNVSGANSYQHLPPTFPAGAYPGAGSTAMPITNPAVDPFAYPSPGDAKRAYWKVSENESEKLLNALEAAHGNKTRAAMLLNMTPRQFSYRLKKLDLE